MFNVLLVPGSWLQVEAMLIGASLRHEINEGISVKHLSWKETDSHAAHICRLVKMSLAWSYWLFWCHNQVLFSWYI